MDLLGTGPVLTFPKLPEHPDLRRLYFLLFAPHLSFRYDNDLTGIIFIILHSHAVRNRKMEGKD